MEKISRNMDSWLYVILAFLVLDRVWPLVETLLQGFVQANSSRLKDLMRQRGDLILAQKEISAQDEYAKWTKNNRALDKINKQIEEEKKALLAQVDGTKATLKKFKLAAITVPFTFLKFYKGKMPIYELPKGIFPNYLQGLMQHGWIYVPLGPLNLKKVSEGATVTVSLGIWLFALLKVVSTLNQMWNAFTSPAVPAPAVSTPAVPAVPAETETETSVSHPVDQPVD